jgi:hypothetical protein
MDKRIVNIYDYYKNGTKGFKIIFISVLFSFLYWILNFLSIEIFDFSIASYLLVSAYNIFPFVWTIITFPFIYTNPLDLIVTAMIIYFVEKIFRIYFNGQSFLKFFIYGNLTGCLAFIISNVLSGQEYSFLGGSILGAYSCLFAIISYDPKMKISLFPIPYQMSLYVAGIVFLFFDIISLMNFNEPIGIFIARITAATFGFFYMKFFQKGNDFLVLSIFNFKKFEKNMASYFNKLFKPKFKIEKNKQEQNKSNHTRPLSDEEFNSIKVKKQKQIDTILDKISKNGYDSLTKQEKEFLFNSSK